MILPVVVVAGAVYGGYRLGKYVAENAGKGGAPCTIDRIKKAVEEATKAIESSWEKTAKSPQPKPEVQPDTDLAQTDKD